MRNNFVAAMLVLVLVVGVGAGYLVGSPKSHRDGWNKLDIEDSYMH